MAQSTVERDNYSDELISVHTGDIDLEKLDDFPINIGNTTQTDTHVRFKSYARVLADI